MSSTENRIVYQSNVHYGLLRKMTKYFAVYKVISWTFLERRMLDKIFDLGRMEGFRRKAKRKRDV